jgi:hypothetical protein
VTSNGLFRACALVEGRVVGTWGSSGTALTVRLLEPVKPEVVATLRRDATEVLRFLNLTDRSAIVVETSA